MYKISVIIPCYNAEKYIAECLDSVLSQTVGREQLEIILVDDCSKDNTIGVLRKYEERYPEQIMLILCDENGRQGTARNIGLSYATGDYISFVDSDDYIVEDMYEQLILAIKKYDADIAQFRYTSIIDELNNRDKLIWTLYDYESNRKRYMLNDRIMNNSCTTKLYKRELLRDAGVQFAQGVCYEEPMFTYPLKLYVKKVCVTEQPFYFYRENDNGTTLAVMSKADSIADHLEVQISLYNQLHEVMSYKEYKQEIDLYFLHSFFVEPLYFFALRGMEFPVGLLREMAGYVMDVFPDWKSNIFINDMNLTDERQALKLIECMNESDEILKEEIAKLF